MFQRKEVAHCLVLVHTLHSLINTLSNQKSIHKVHGEAKRGKKQEPFKFSPIHNMNFCSEYGVLLYTKKNVSNK